MYQALIIDDESDARGVLRKMLELFCPQVTSVADATNSADALALAKKRSFDLAFVDIKLRKESGLELAEKLKVHCPNLIFVTAYDEYAVDAFRTSALHYLMKPVDPELLQEAVTRAVAGIRRQASATVSLVTKSGIVKLEQHTIRYLHGEGNYCTFHCQHDRSYLVSRNLAHYLKLLDATQFIRIHQSYAVRIDAVAQYLVNGGYFVVLKTGEKLPISRRRKDAFLSALQG